MVPLLHPRRGRKINRCVRILQNKMLSLVFSLDFIRPFQIQSNSDGRNDGDEKANEKDAPVTLHTNGTERSFDETDGEEGAKAAERDDDDGSQWLGVREGEEVSYDDYWPVIEVQRVTMGAKEDERGVREERMVEGGLCTFQANQQENRSNARDCTNRSRRESEEDERLKEEDREEGEDMREHGREGEGGEVNVDDEKSNRGARQDLIRTFHCP